MTTGMKAEDGQFYSVWNWLTASGGNTSTLNDMYDVSLGGNEAQVERDRPAQPCLLSAVQLAHEADCTDSWLAI